MGKLSLANLSLYRLLEQPDPARLAQALQQYEDLENISHTDQPGEFYAALTLLLFMSGNQKRAEEVLARVRQESSESWVTDRIWLDFAEAVIHRQPWDQPLSWFREHGFQRAVNFVERVAHVVEQS